MKAQKDIRILVIDDEQIFLDGVRLGFAISGFKGVRVESDPRKVVTILESEEEFDIALIDITMPFVSGIELLELIKKMSPNKIGSVFPKNVLRLHL